MTNQEKKAWLMQYRAAEREERRLCDELERWRSQAESATARYGADTGGGGDGRSLEHAAEHIADSWSARELNSSGFAGGLARPSTPCRMQGTGSCSG